MEEHSVPSTSPNINSVLKPPKPRVPLQDIMAAVHDEDNTADRKRVSFANVNKIKEFSAGAESMVVCHTPAYEEPFYLSSDSSYPSGVDGWTPAKNQLMFKDSSNVQAFIQSEQKEQFPLHLNPDNSLCNFDEISEKLTFQNLQRFSLSKPKASGLLTQDSNTLFATSCSSLDAMDLTKCIDNPQSVAKNSTRFSMGMDLTECMDRQHSARNSTKFSVGMDLTGCVDIPHNATSNATRFSLGMDMTNLVGKSLNTMSLSSEGMSLTKAVTSQEPYTDQRSRQLVLCNNSPNGVNLDESTPLELTDAINNPKFSAMSMLYSVKNTDLKNNIKLSVLDKTRCSVSGMDLTKTAISNCSSARRKSTRYSLSNMDLTEVVEAGDHSGLDFTEVINDPKIVAMSTRYSVNDMDLTAGSISKDHSRFSENFIETTAAVEEKLNYSADSETSMDFTKPVHNILQSCGQSDTQQSGYSIETCTTNGEAQNRNTSCSSVHAKLHGCDVNKEFNEPFIKTNELVVSDCTLNCVEKVENKTSRQNDKVNLISSPALLQQICYNNTNIQNTQTVFQTQDISESAAMNKLLSPEDKQVKEVHTSNLVYKADPALSSSNKAKKVQDVCLKQSIQSENKLKSDEVSTYCTKLQECKVSDSETNVKRNEHLEMEKIVNENMDISDAGSSELVQSNFVSSKINSSFFPGDLALKSVKEVSNCKLSSLENQEENVPIVDVMSMETSELDITNNLNGSPDLALLKSSQPLKSDYVYVDRENLQTAVDEHLTNCSKFDEKNSVPNTSVSSIKNKLQLIGNSFEREPASVDVGQVKSYDVRSPSKETTDFARTLTVEEVSIEVENSLSYSVRKGLPSSEISVSKENIDIANVSNNTLSMSISDNRSHLEESTAPDTLTDVSTINSLCASNITMTRGGATRNSTVFSMSPSLSETSKNHDSLSDHNMEQTSVLNASLPLIQRIAINGDMTMTLSETQQEEKESSDTLNTKSQKGGKRSFEEALKPEDDTRESPLKQLCLSRGDCDLLINVTAPSFLMDTMNAPNETFHQLPDATLQTCTVPSPLKNQSSVELTVSKKSAPRTNIELKDMSISFGQNRNPNDVCDNSFSLRVDISTDHDNSSIVVLKKDENKAVNVEIHEHGTRTLESSDHPSEQTVGNKCVLSQCNAVQKPCSPPESLVRLEPTYRTNKSVGSALELCHKQTKPTSGVGKEEYLKLRHSMAVSKSTSSIQQKEMDLFCKSNKIKNLGKGLFVCEIIPNWIELHFVADLNGYIVNPSYKIICKKVTRWVKPWMTERDRAVGEYLLQQVKAFLPPQNASDLLTQLEGPAYARLAELARSVSLICKYHNGELKGNILTVELINSKKPFWIFVDINIKYPQNLTQTDINISKQKTGEFKLSHLRSIFDSIKKGPGQLLLFAKELLMLQWH